MPFILPTFMQPTQGLHNSYIYENAHMTYQPLHLVSVSPSPADDKCSSVTSVGKHYNICSCMYVQWV
jgi:hypothetical protein